MISTADKIRATEHAVEAGEQRLREAVDALAAEHRRLQCDRALLERLRQRLKLEKLGGKKLADAELPIDVKTGGAAESGNAAQEQYLRTGTIEPAIADALRIAIAENMRVHVGCGGEVTGAVVLHCHGCDKRVLRGEIIAPPGYKWGHE